ncbi:uncharacterized protein LOC135830503 [Sycon ciliatum]|uniref:uncharacterized protein LOC135830503 n=1 Tax=Sycon ciliatum TaxID=27933 RepID=UPI0020A89312|eukprot:scpid61300/ scgid33443/ Cyclic AMP-responsive element-binding protein 3-like protein 4; Androgen-induced basic leucine zipper protein; Processed cyclic AMP-responsive element-binding protein 3-like protein 4
MERAASDESIHLLHAGEEHNYARCEAMSAAAASSSGSPISEILSLDGCSDAAPRQPSSDIGVYVPDNWMETLLDSTVNWDNVDLSLQELQQLQSGTADTLPTPETAGLLNDELFGSVGVGADFGGNHSDLLPDDYQGLLQLFAPAQDPLPKRGAANSVLTADVLNGSVQTSTPVRTSGTLNSPITGTGALARVQQQGQKLDESAQDQLEKFHRWLQSIQTTSPVPSSESPPMAVPQMSPGAVSSASSSTDAGYDSDLHPHTPEQNLSSGVASPPDTAASGADLSSTHSITDNLLRGGRSAALVLGESVLQQASSSTMTAALPTTTANRTAAPSSSSSAQAMDTSTHGSRGGGSASASVGSPSSGDDDCCDGGDEDFCLEEKEQEKMSGPTAFNSEEKMFWNHQRRFLTDEEREVLEADGYPVPKQLPFNPMEVKALKQVRRKIKNKLSASDSRRKKKHYITGLEKRMKACTSDNASLQKRIQQLEKQNKSLLVTVDTLRQQVSGTVSAAAKSMSGRYGLLLFALCFVVMLPSMPSSTLVPLFSAKTATAVSHMPTTSPAATAFDYRLKEYRSRTLLGFSLPTGAPDLADATAEVTDDSPMHYISEAGRLRRNGTGLKAATGDAVPGYGLGSATLNVHAGRLLIQRVGK